MRKINKFIFGCFLAALIGILPVLTYAQDTGSETKMTHKEKKELFDKYWYVNLNIGAMFPYSDISQRRFEVSSESMRLGYGAAIGWQFHPIWGLRAKGTGGKVYGESRDNVDWLQPLYDNVYFKANLFDYHLDFTINFSNLISGYNPDRLVDVYGAIGGGQVQWNTYGYNAANDSLIIKNGNSSAGAGNGIGDRTLVFELNSALGVKFNISPSFDLGVEGELKFLDSDVLDNYKHGTVMVKNDMFSYIALNASYKFGGSDPLKKMKKNYETVTFKAEPDPLEAHGGKIPVKITGTFPEGYFHPKAAMYAEPFLVCEGTKIPLKPILLKGTEVKGEGIVISKDGGTFTYETVVDYNESCRAAELVLEPVIFVPKGELPANMTREDALGYKKNVELPSRKLADGTIVTPEKFMVNQTGSVVPHGYLKEEILTKNAKLFFEVNKFALNWNVPQNKVEGNKAALSGVLEHVKLGYKIKNISIDGWASPEGEETFNQGLSENRTKTTQKYLVEEIKKAIKAKDTKMTIKDAEKDITYNLAHHGPDWNGFITALQNSDMPDKNSMLNVINSAGTPAMKEQKIREMIVIYPDIDVKLLQPLRRGEIIANTFMPKKTDEEIATLATSDPTKLDEKELLYAGSMQQDPKIRLQIYKSAINQWPDSYKGYSNAGATEIELGDLAAAKAHLEKAAQLNANSGEVHNNLGIIYAVEGDYVKAEEHFTKASQLGTDASYNMGVLSIHKGDYSKALSQFGNKTCDYNVALAYIAKKDYPPAEKQLSCAPKTAESHYLMAILGSRTGNTTMLFDNLKSAIDMNPEYKAEAKIDREFIKYFADPNFTSLVQ